MLRFVFFLASSSILFSASAQALPKLSFLQMAQGTMNLTWKRLEDCGLKKMNAYDPSLPYPQTPALFAVVAKNKGVVAYYQEIYTGGSATLLFKTPRGGQVHRISFAQNEIKWSIPNPGVVAFGNQFYTPAGPNQRYYCRSQVTTIDGLRNCVDEFFIGAVTGTASFPYSLGLCGYAN